MATGDEQKMATYKYKCIRTHRFCDGGAYDGGDGWGIDCPTGDKEACGWRIKVNQK